MVRQRWKKIIQLKTVVFILCRFTEEELLQAKLESEKSIEKLTHERNALQERVHDNESMFSEEQLRELYNSMEVKSQRIANLEQQLSEVHKKDSKICELEMEIDILQGGIFPSSWAFHLVCAS